MTLHEAVLALHDQFINCEKYGYKFCGEGKDEIIVYLKPGADGQLFLRIPVIFQGWHVSIKTMGEIITGDGLDLK